MNFNPSTFTFNTPRYPLKEFQKPFYETWYFIVNHPTKNRSLWVHYSWVQNKKDRDLHVWAVLRNENQKMGISQKLPPLSFSADFGKISFGDSILSPDKFSGKINLNNKSVQWNFDLTIHKEKSFNLIPPTLSQLKLVKNYAMTVNEEIFFNGSIQWGDEKFEFENSPGMQGHLAGPRNGYGWVWAHGNVFDQKEGAPTSFVFEGLSGSAHWYKSIHSPTLTTLFLMVDGETIELNGFLDSVTIESKISAIQWEFQAKKRGMLLTGKIFTEIKDYFGVNFKDPYGNNLFCYNNTQSSCDIKIIGLKNKPLQFISQKKMSYEWVRRKPYFHLDLKI